MAIRQFTEPDINLFFDDLNQALVLNNKASFVGRGYINVMFTNIDNAAAPALMAGSSWEQNGVLVFADSETAVSGTPADNAVNYVYARPDMTLVFGANAPVWQESNNVKGGWYDGNDRALLRFYYSADGPVYGNKTIPDSYNAMTKTNAGYAPPSSGGHLVGTGAVNAAAAYTIPPGAYRYELKGGTGGTGGWANYDRYPSRAGGVGAAGETVTGFIFVEPGVPKKVFLSVGGDGNKGGNGGSFVQDAYDGGAGGGGGCSGGWSYIFYDGTLIEARGGSGGGGGASRGCGGGGGGGYGTGSRGQVDSRYSPDAGGYGGSNGYGGAMNNNPTGGGGYYAGYGGAGSGYITGYGAAGNPGGASGSPMVDTGTAPGGASRRRTDSPRYDGTPSNIYQGGGGGGAAAGPGGVGIAGGAGGSGLISSSRGYARIYRMG
jgi:hypothetical protein